MSNVPLGCPTTVSNSLSIQLLSVFSRILVMTDVASGMIAISVSLSSMAMSSAVDIPLLISLFSCAGVMMTTSVINLNIYFYVLLLYTWNQSTQLARHPTASEGTAGNRVLRGLSASVIHAANSSCCSANGAGGLGSMRGATGINANIGGIAAAIV
jgi:hypothetical protein